MSRIIRLAASLAAAGALLFTAACGGDAGSGDGGSGNNADMSAFQDCLKKHGVTMPEGGRGGGRPSVAPTDRPSGRPTDRPSSGPSMFAETQEAMQACASLRPEGSRGGPGGPDGPDDGGGQRQNGS